MHTQVRNHAHTSRQQTRDAHLILHKLNFLRNLHTHSQTDLAKTKHTSRNLKHFLWKNLCRFITRLTTNEEISILIRMKYVKSINQQKLTFKR